jgi:CO/xanthine dehydrogenase Mo-binding subunit
MLVEGQIDGQVSMGQGHVLTEELRVEQGCVINPSFLEYKMPSAMELVPTAYLDVITETYQKDRHYNTKEVGEGYVSGTVAAVANAVYNATGVRLKRTPFSPDRVLDGWEDLRKKERKVHG